MLGGISKHVFISQNSGSLSEKDVAKWVCQNYPGNTFTIFDGGWTSPNTRGMFRLFVGNTSEVDGNEYPKYACGYFMKYVSGSSDPYFRYLNFYNGSIKEFAVNMTQV